MKTIKSTMFGMLALAFALLITSCGGSGSGVATTAAGGSTSGNVIVSKGVIQKFGSVFVNGMEFRTSGATLMLPDDNAVKVLQNETEIQNNLERGMVVTVKGRLDDNGLGGAATEIEFRDALKGKIDDKGVDFVKVMGQTIILDDSIKSALAGLAIGDDVQISALSDDKGGLRATHIKKMDAKGEFEIKGFVSAYSGGTTMTLLQSPTATTGLSVNLAGAALPAAGIKNGDFVEVKSAASPANDVLTATAVKLEDEIKAAENEGAELEGFIAALGANTLTIAGQQVSFGDNTRFVGGLVGDLGVGMKVEVEGTIVNGILAASKITFKDNLRIRAAVTAVDPAASTITLLGKVFAVPTNLEIRDNGNLIALAALNGRSVDLRGMLAADGLSITATRIDVRSNSQADATLRGPVSAFSAAANSLTIAGIQINTSGAEFNGNDESHGAITAAEFFAALTPNITVVKVRWNPFTSVTAPAKQLELEN